MKKILGVLALTAATAALLACSDDDGGTKPDPAGSSEGSSGTSSEEKASSGSAGEPGICGEGWTKVAPDDERIVYEGTWYPEVGPDSAVLKRHADVCMNSSACFVYSTITSIGYHKMMAGVTMRLKARADTIYMKWNELWQRNESQRSLPFGAVRFGLMVDGKYRGLIGPESRDSSLSVLEPHGEYMWLVSTSYDSTVHCVAIPVNSPDKTAEIEVIMPHRPSVSRITETISVTIFRLLFGYYSILSGKKQAERSIFYSIKAVTFSLWQLQHVLCNSQLFGEF